jgi:excinuclease ABC subunit B
MKLKAIECFDPINNSIKEKFDKLTIYPANMFVTSPDVLQNAIHQIQGRFGRTSGLF